MAAGILDRCFSVLEMLSHEGAGLSLNAVVARTGIPVGTAHRMLTELRGLGYVRQDEASQRYLPSLQLLCLGVRHLAASGAVDFAQPILDSLAAQSGELVRLALVERDGLVWVAKAQGAAGGLRYDPEMGTAPALSCTATGQAWLATLPEDTALQIVARQGFGKLTEHGPQAPRTIRAFVARLSAARQAGYASVVDSGAPGTSAMAAAVLQPGSGRVLGTVSIAGPTLRLTAARMSQLAPELLTAARSLGDGSAVSAMFQPAPELVTERPARRGSTR